MQNIEPSQTENTKNNLDLNISLSDSFNSPSDSKLPEKLRLEIPSSQTRKRERKVKNTQKTLSSTSSPLKPFPSCTPIRHITQRFITRSETTPTRNLNIEFQALSPPNLKNATQSKEKNEMKSPKNKMNLQELIPSTTEDDKSHEESSEENNENIDDKTLLEIYRMENQIKEAKRKIQLLKAQEKESKIKQHQNEIHKLVFENRKNWYEQQINSPEPKFGKRPEDKRFGYLSSYSKRYSIKKFLDKNPDKRDCFRRKTLFQPKVGKKSKTNTSASNTSVQSDTPSISDYQNEKFLNNQIRKHYIGPSRLSPASPKADFENDNSKTKLEYLKKRLEFIRQNRDLFMSYNEDLQSSDDNLNSSETLFNDVTTIKSLVEKQPNEVVQALGDLELERLFKKTELDEKIANFINRQKAKCK